MSSDLIIKSRSRDLGGFFVNRSLPSVQRRHVGPFVFLDHMGPMKVDQTHAMDVRPHPHIGLSTVTYLFSGHGLHRDSLGSNQVIEPGDLNWMTAGSGIVHSERTPEGDRAPNAQVEMHGVQIWVGLPVDQEECEPKFTHYPKERLPTIEMAPHWQAKLLIGEYSGVKSPVEHFSPMLFIDVKAFADSNPTRLAFEETEIAVFVVSGQIEINGTVINANDLLFASNPREVEIRATEACRFLIIGGEPFPEPRHMWWNFVSSREERIRQAADDWKDQKFKKVPGETDFIPLP